MLKKIKDVEYLSSMCKALGSVSERLGREGGVKGVEKLT